ncbi:MAG: hypothetical protein AAFV33_06220 [Chloroflexota bacterium]
MSMDASHREKPCPICGKTDYTWGNATSIDKRDRAFKSMFIFLDDDHVNPHTLVFEERLVGNPLVARRCNECGNVQTFVELQEPRLIDRDKPLLRFEIPKAKNKDEEDDS